MTTESNGDKPTYFRLPSADYEAVKKIAKDSDHSAAQIVRRFVKYALEQWRKGSLKI